MTSAHEAYPGHHTQAWYARQHPNALRSTLWSGAFAEGWAVYGERLLVKQGLGGSENARYALIQARSGMVVAANAILDIKLQRGEMTDEQALRFMEDEGFQEKALAEKKLLRAKLDSTQLCQYFLGLERDRGAGAPRQCTRPLRPAGIQPGAHRARHRAGEGPPELLRAGEVTLQPGQAGEQGRPEVGGGQGEGPPR